jgi:hypothetical protein
LPSGNPKSKVTLQSTPSTFKADQDLSFELVGMADTWAIPKVLPVKRPNTASGFTGLEQSLKQMGLEKLLFLLWNIQSDSYVKGFVPNAPAQSLFEEVRGDRNKLEDIEFIGQAFQCRTEGQKFLLQRSRLSDRYFHGAKNQSHGWRLNQCNNTKLFVVLQFLIPILHPKKPTFCPMSLANTVIKVR